MTNWAEIRYRDFWDVPRMFVLEYGGRRYLFDNTFDEVVEDYTAHYDVLELPSSCDLSGSWLDLRAQATCTIGRTPLRSVRFDETKRKFVDTSILSNLISEAALARSLESSTALTANGAPQRVEAPATHAS